MTRQPRRLMRQGVADLPTRADVDSYIGPNGEVISDGETLRLHDGASPGGIQLVSVKSPFVLGALARDGDASGVTATATGLSTPHILADWLKFPITLERFGCKGDFDGTAGTDNTSAFQRGIDSGEELRLSLGGRYYLPQTGILVSNRPFSLVGQRGSALVFGAAVANGLTVSAADYVTGIEVANLLLLTMSQEAGSALSIALPAPDGAVPINNPSVAVRNTIMAGLNSGQHGWRRGGYLLNCHSAPVEGCRVYGRQDGGDTTMGRFTKMTEGFLAEHTGAPNIGGAPRFRGTTVVGSQSGIRLVGNAEGGEIIDCQLEAVLDGVLNEMSTLRPGFVVRGGHINATRRCIYLFRTANFKIADVLLYKFDYAKAVGYGALPAGVQTAGETVGIVLDQCQKGTIGLNEYQLGGVSGGADVAGEWTAVRLKDTLYTTVERQNVSLGTTGVSLTGGSADNDITPPSMYGDFGSTANPIAAVRDATSATSNFVRGSARAVKNASAVNVAASSTFVEIARIDLGSPLVGTVFDITAAIEFTKGATAGLSLFQISALAGSVDFSGKGALLIRANQGANATDIGNASCPVRVTASGATTLILQGLAQGSATTVAAGSATIAAARR